jgi:hypothetical protein
MFRVVIFRVRFRRAFRGGPEIPPPRCLPREAQDRNRGAPRARGNGEDRVIVH